MKRINSRTKGANGERELAKFLTDHGYPARRGRQFSGSPDSPDVVCETLNDFHIECKRVQKTDIYGWLAQATRDAGDSKYPVVMHRQNDKDWVAILPLNDFLQILNSYITS